MVLNYVALTQDESGDSILITGSAAGVAIMGILRITFIWYLRNISGYAFLGYISGLITYFILNI